MIRSGPPADIESFRAAGAATAVRRRGRGHGARRRAAAGGAPPLLALLDREWGDAALDDILEATRVPRWSLERTLFEPAADFLARPGKALRARLVGLGWVLGGGTGAPPEDLGAVIELLHAGSLIVDDIEDASTHRRARPALHRLYGLPVALNTGNWLYFWAFDLLARLGLPAGASLTLHRYATRAVLRCHVGQALDVGLRVDALRQADVPRLVAGISELKTGSLVALALAAGALAAGAPAARTTAIAHFGRQLGVGLQMLDDAANLGAARLGAKRHEDLRLGRVTWTWAWLARTLARPRFAALQRAARAVADGTAPAGPLAARLRTALGADGHRAARHHIGAATDELFAALGPTVSRDPVHAELARFEESYV